MTRIIITGAPKVSGTGSANPVPQPRVEIHEFVKNAKWLSLFIQALAQFMAQDQDKDLSHFGVASIHGLPFRPWADSGSSTRGQWGGYCSHGTTLFPTWHRPYVAAYEQFLQQAASKIALGYNSDEWVRAAETMRLPYWDWAAAPVPPDELIAMPQITITTPNGSQKVPNPFWGYVFHPIDKSFEGRFASWPKTLRRPTNTAPNATDNVADLKRTLTRFGPQTKRDTYMLFSIANWDDFSNHTTSTGSSFNSLEGVHDNIHVNIGGSGHMSSIPHAAHDPIFYLHHCNVDRLLSLWQAIHYDVKITDGSSGGGTWTIASGQTIGVNTPLTPFWRTQDSSWVSTAGAAGVLDFTVFGYTYPEFKGLDLTNKNAVRAAISRKVEELYAPQSASPRIRGALASAGVSNLASVGVGAPEAALVSYEREWSVRIACNQFESDQSFYVLLFLGKPPDDSKEWLASPHLIASQGFFVNSTPEQCENCKKHQEQGDLVEMFVHLSELLLEKGVTGGTLDAAKIIPYLKDGLHHRILKIDGTVVDVADFKSMKVELLSTPLRSVNHSPLPHLGEVKKHVTF